MSLIHPILSENPYESFELDLENTIILPPRYKGYHTRMTELEFLSRYADNHVSYATFIGLVLDSMAQDHNVVYPDMPWEMKVIKSEGTRKLTTS